MLKRRQVGEKALIQKGEPALEYSDNESSSESSESLNSDNGNLKTKLNGTRKILILSSRGINARQRHLMNNLLSIIPHSVKGS